MSSCCNSIHSARGVGERPERQKILSSYTTGKPAISPNCRARVDFPAAPRPSMTTRFMRDHFDRLHFDLRESPRARDADRSSPALPTADHLTRANALAVGAVVGT